MDWSFLDAAFRMPGTWHFEDDFPVWSNRFNVGGFHREEIRLANGTLRATASVRFAKLAQPDALPKMIAVIGAVATDPASRGQGLASVCVERCLQKARAAGASVAVLWGSEHKLYGRLGFRLAGVQLLGPLGAIEVGNSEQLNNTGKAPKLHEGWVPALFDLIAGERTRGLILQERDRTWFSQHRLGIGSVRIRGTAACAAINRGMPAGYHA